MIVLYCLLVFQNGTTPLMIASGKGHTNIVNILLTVPGIDVNMKDKVKISVIAY